MIRLTFIFLLLSFCLLNICFAQTMQGPPPGECEINSPSGIAEIPFELVRNHIIVKAKINEKHTVRLVLDTGFPAHGAMLYKTSSIEALNLPYSGKAMIAGPSGDMKPADIIMGASISLPGVKLTGVDVVAMPHTESTKRSFDHHDGVFGYSLFSRYIVDIDFDKQIIKLMEPEKYEYSSQIVTLDFDLYYNTPFIKTEVELESGAKENINMILDLGATHAISLNIRDEKNIVPSKKNIVSKASGVSGDFEVILGRVKSFSIADYKFINPVSSFTKLDQSIFPGSNEEGNLGMEILKRFNIILDYNSKKISFKPNNLFSQPFEYNMSGIRYYRNEDGYYTVENILENSPAERAEIFIDDVIVEINGLDTKTMEFDDIKEIFRNNGKKIKLKLKRNEKIINQEIVLKRMI